MFLDNRKFATIKADRSVKAGVLYTFPVKLPFRGDYFYVQGIVKDCTSFEEKTENKIAYKVYIEQLAGATEQDDRVFDVYLAFKHVEKELELIRQQNEETLRRIQLTIKNLERASLNLEQSIAVH